MNQYHDYYVRALPADWPALVDLGVRLGALRVDVDEAGAERVNTEGPGCWDVIGVLYRPTGNTITTDEGDTPEMAPVTDAAGVPYWHANLRTVVDLGARARELAPSDPAIAAAMAQLTRFFLLDADGNPRQPSAPARMFA